MATGQLLGEGVIQNIFLKKWGGAGLAKIVNTIFNAQFFSKKKKKNIII
jgi:hypothetical protein